MIVEKMWVQVHLLAVNPPGEGIFTVCGIRGWNWENAMAFTFTFGDSQVDTCLPTVHPANRLVQAKLLALLLYFMKHKNFIYLE